MRVQFLVVATIALSAGQVFAKRPFVLAGERTTAVVRVPASADESSRLAARELSDYVAKATGRRLRVVEGVPDVGTPSVMVGTLCSLGALPPSVRERLESMREPEASWSGVADGKLWFVGREEVAELRAVYHFLETRLGVRWFNVPTAEDPGELVPKADMVEIDAFSEFREPDFGIRRLDYTGAACYPLPTNGMTFAVRNGFQVPATQQLAIPYGDKSSPLYRYFAPRIPRRMQSLGGWHETFRQANPPSKTFAEHPEYFALVGGRRTKGAPAEEQYCLSNPGMRQNVVDYVLRRLDESGGKGEYLFGQVDTSRGMCECDACRALDGTDESDNNGPPNKATRFFKTVNWIADKVFAKHPEADLRVWAYASYREIPSVKIDSRIKKVWFCPHGRCYGHFLDDPTCARNARMYALMREWKVLKPQLYTYEYLNCTPHLYACCESVAAHDVRLMKRMGLVGWKEEIGFPDQNFVPPRADEKIQARRCDSVPSNWQWYYVVGHLLWNSAQDENALLEDVESKYYGAAYPAMRRYQALRRKVWRENRYCLGFPDEDQRRPTLLDREGVRDELRALLAEAEGLASGNRLVAYRVGRDREWFERHWVGANEALKKLRGKSIRIFEAKEPIVIDGDGSDAAWGSATFTDDLLRAYVPEAKRVPPPGEVATSFGMTYDRENLYVLATAREPSPEKMKMGDDSETVWGDDCVEVMLFPPSAENRYFHFAVNAKGVVYGATSSGGRSPDAFGAEVKCKMFKDRYVVEMRIPAKGVAPIVPGKTWRVQCARNRLVDDRFTPRGDSRWSFEGAHYNDILSFRNMEIGKVYLKNGSLDKLGKDDMPEGWHFVEKPSTVVKRGSGYAVQLGRTMWADMAHGALAQSDRPRRLRYSFRASGTGTVYVQFLRFVDTPDSKAKYGYKRERRMPNGTGGVYQLAAEEKVYSGDYEMPAGEWNAICLSVSGGDALVDDVAVNPLQ